MTVGKVRLNCRFFVVLRDQRNKTFYILNLTTVEMNLKSVRRIYQ